MPQINNIVINDAAATPLAHTFSPVRVTTDGPMTLAEFENRAANSGVAIGFEDLSVGLRRPLHAGPKVSSDAINRVYKASVKLALPILEVTSPNTGTGIQPAPTVAYVMEADVNFRIPERSTLQNRKDLRKLVEGAIANAIVTAVIENLETVY